MKGKMRHLTIAVIVASIAITIFICILIFNTTFAKNTIDYFSFVAASILIIDGFYKIGHYKGEPYFPNHFIRHLRIIIGASIFTIHIMQYIYGV